MKSDHRPRQRALSIGTVMIDIITVIADKDIELMTLRNMTSSFLMLEQGRKVESESIETFIGGGAANTAVCMRRLGLDVSILGLVGRDLNGRKIRDRLQQEQIDLSYLATVTEAGSGIAVHISSHDRNAAIFTHRGANCRLTADHVEAVDFSAYDLVYVTNLSNESADQYPLIIARAVQAGCFISSNPGIRQLTKRPRDFLDCLDTVSLLSINRDECAALVPHLLSSGQPPTAKNPAPDDDMPPLLATGFQIAGFSLGLMDCMKILAGHGPDYVVITDGGQGAYLLHRDQLYYCPPQEAEMQGSAGAGDCFSSTLSRLICAGESPDGALLAAALNAASVISQVDTQSGLLSGDALDQILAGKDIEKEIRRWTTA